MPSITKRKSQGKAKTKGGKYYIRWYVNGKVKWKSTGQKTKDKAQLFYDNWILDKLTPASSFTVKELFLKRLKYMSLHHRPKTILIYEKVFRLYSGMFKDCLISKVIPDDLEEYKANRIAAGLCKVSVNIEIRALKATFRYAVKKKMLKENPFAESEYFETDEKKYVYIPDDHVKLILDNTENPVIKDVFLVALRTAMRRGEILNLKYSDVNLENRTIQILVTKTKKPRDIPMSDVLYKLLYNYFYDESGHSKLYNPDDCIFNVTEDLCTKRFKKIIRKLGLPEVYKFHSMRHTAITNLLRKSGNSKTAQFVAGHRSLKTTEGYLHIIPEEVRKAMNQL